MYIGEVLFVCGLVGVSLIEVGRVVYCCVVKIIVEVKVLICDIGDGDDC